MAAQFSDPAWWPKPPPVPPKQISPLKVVLGTLVPAVALIGVVVLIVTKSHDSGASVTPTRSLAAFERCARAHGVDPAELSGAKGQRALEACRDKLPAGAEVGSFGAPAAQDTSQESPQEQFNDCVRNATASLPNTGFGGGRYGGRPSSEFRSAVAVCQSLIESQGGETPTTGTEAASPPPA